MCKCFVFLQQLHQHCIAWCFLIHLPGMCLVHLLNFKTPKPKKKSSPKWSISNQNFLEKWCFWSSERLPPLSAVPPTNKKTHPPISKPPLAPLINAGTTMAEGAKIQLQCSHILIDLSSAAHLLLIRRDPAIIAPMIERTCIWIIWCHEICHPWVDDAYW